MNNHRWLPAIADAVDNSVEKPRTPDEPKMEDILGTALNQALVEAIAAKANYTRSPRSISPRPRTQMTAFSSSRGATSRP